MSAKLDVVSWGGASSSGELNALEQNNRSGDKGVLSDDGVRVTEESNDLVGESNAADQDDVDAGGGLESVEADSLDIFNVQHDVARTTCRVAETGERDEGRESSGVAETGERDEGGELSGVAKTGEGDKGNAWGIMMNMVQRVLKGNNGMDEEEEDLSQSNKDGFALDLGADTEEWQGVDAWRRVIGEPSSASRMDLRSTVIDKDSDKLDFRYPAQGTGFYGNQDSVLNENVPGGNLRLEEIINAGGNVLMPKARGKHQTTEKEGEYYASDLVWGKVRSHPWWPGQIFEPSAASDKAIKFYKEESHLVAYFGDRTFAWNEVAKIKPFRMHFWEMAKQDNGDPFCHAVRCALDEIVRRVEVGLTCQCLPKEVHYKINFQEVENAGIREESSRRAGGDSLSSAASFSPGQLVEFLVSSARRPQSKTDGLQFATVKAQLMAFNRWKGRGTQLSVLEEWCLLLENDDQSTAMGVGKDSIKGKEKLLPEAISNGADDFLFKKRNSTVVCGSSRKRKDMPGDRDGPEIKRKRLSALMSSHSLSLQANKKKSVSGTGRKAGSSAKNLEIVGSRSSQGALAISGAGDSQRVEIIPAEIPNPEVILSKLILAAKTPMQGHKNMTPTVGFLRGLRVATSLEKQSSENAKNEAGKDKGKEPFVLGTTDTLFFEDTKDSYWTDRIIQTNSQDQVSFEAGKNCREMASPLEANTDVILNAGDNKEKVVVLDLDAGNPSTEVPVEDRPTALILNFSSLDSVPSVPNLNEIFSRYGPLYESDTKISTKGKRVKVIFKRREDAETAFSSSGKYNIFGPALVSYKLHYEPVRKPRAKRNRKGASGST